MWFQTGYMGWQLGIDHGGTFTNIVARRKCLIAPHMSGAGDAFIIETPGGFGRS